MRRIGEHRFAVSGSGPALLLLHGHPQTHVTLRKIAPDLATSHTVVTPDLRGYGDSDRPEGGELHINYSKRAMAADLVELMRALGHDRFAVVGMIAAAASPTAWPWIIPTR